MSKKPSIYIVTNKRNGTLYTGVTSNLVQRIYQHKHEFFKGFSKKYHCNKLVYYEMYSEMNEAIYREKMIKARSRKYKISLIESINPDWDDLYEQWFSNG